MTDTPPGDLPAPLDSLAPLLDGYGYPAVGLLVFLDNCGVPVPGQTVLVLAAVYAGAGRLSIAGVVTVAVLAAVAGDSLGYLIGRTGGHRLIERWGRYVLLTPERMERGEHFFTRHGGKVVTVARFVDVLRQTNGIVAGTTGMPWRRFLPANVLGALLWVGVWASAGYLAGDNIGPLYRELARYQLVLLAAVGAAAAGLVAYRLRRRQLRRRQDGRGVSGRSGSSS